MRRQHSRGRSPKTKPSITDARAFIAANLRLQPAPTLPGILLYAAHPGSGIARLGAGKPDDQPPYWAYSWAGGTVLARHILEHPETVRGRRVLDLGAGSGIVAIAAAKCGAAAVIAADIDANAIAAIGLNADANTVEIEALHADLLSGEPPAVDIVLAGDVFYDAWLAGRVLPFLVACRSAGIDVLIGDPLRAPLPQHRLRPVAEYAVSDFGEGNGGEATLGCVFTVDLPD
jgi:predicted nicotinamide N-methyase